MQTEPFAVDLFLSLNNNTLYMKLLYILPSHFFTFLDIDYDSAHTGCLESDGLNHMPHGLNRTTQLRRVPSAPCSCTTLKLIQRWELNTAG